jgi:hypothetical protein
MPQLKHQLPSGRVVVRRTHHEYTHVVVVYGQGDAFEAVASWHHTLYRASGAASRLREVTPSAVVAVEAVNRGVRQ